MNLPPKNLGSIDHIQMKSMEIEVQPVQKVYQISFTLPMSNCKQRVRVLASVPNVQRLHRNTQFLMQEYLNLVYWKGLEISSAGRRCKASVKRFECSPMVTVTHVTCDTSPGTRNCHFSILAICQTSTVFLLINMIKHRRSCAVSSFPWLVRSRMLQMRMRYLTSMTQSKMSTISCSQPPPLLRWILSTFQAQRSLTGTSRYGRLALRPSPFPKTRILSTSGVAVGEENNFSESLAPN